MLSTGFVLFWAGFVVRLLVGLFHWRCLSVDFDCVTALCYYYVVCFDLMSVVSLDCSCCLIAGFVGISFS